MDIRSLLEHPFFYELAQTIGGWYSGAQQRIIEEFVRPCAGLRILDVGCAAGHAVSYLKGTDYVGLDMNPAYIAKAQSRYPQMRFMVADAASQEVAALGQFDCILLFGLLHHLSDAEATTLFDTARRLLDGEGRVISVDNCWYDGQSAFERYAVGHDRGKFPRRAEGYQALARQSFSNVKVHMRQGMLRYPYALLIMESGT